jgi:hypothetical protein
MVKIDEKLTIKLLTKMGVKMILKNVTIIYKFIDSIDQE